MGDKIIARREVLGANSVYGVLDGDFHPWQGAQQSPRPWENVEKNIQFGWRWERKEVENYLIDPRVVERALGSLPPDYQGVLEQAAASIGTYQACRVALTLVRPLFTPLDNSFGAPRGRYKHKFPDLSQLDSNEMHFQKANEVVLGWNTKQSVSPEVLLNTFESLIPECHPSGARCREFLTGFAGKDLLWSIDPYLRTSGFPSCNVFIEKVIMGIERSTGDIWNWLPEWVAFRRLVEAT